MNTCKCGSPSVPGYYLCSPCLEAVMEQEEEAAQLLLERARDYLEEVKAGIQEDKLADHEILSSRYMYALVRALMSLGMPPPMTGGANLFLTITLRTILEDYAEKVWSQKQAAVVEAESILRPPFEKDLGSKMWEEMVEGAWE